MRTGHETKQGNHSRQRDIPQTDRERDHEIDEEHEEMEILPKHIAKFCKDKKLQKVMEILLSEEKGKYFLGCPDPFLLFGPYP